jgi:transposase-like protein
MDFGDRRHHSAEFKAKVVEDCRGAGVSMAAVALAHGLNANLLRRWMVENKWIGRTPGPANSPPQQEFMMRGASRTRRRYSRQKVDFALASLLHFNSGQPSMMLSRALCGRHCRSKKEAWGQSLGRPPG